jgi:toxin ParE1/3/4
MAQVLRTERALRDLVDIWIYVAADSPAAADRLLETIDQSCQRLSQFPEMGRLRPELGLLSEVSQSATT